MPNQRDLVKVYYNFPQGKSSPHMVIVLSANNAIQQEDAFLGIVVTSAFYNDEFTFKLTDAMLTSGSLPKNSQIRLHLIQLFKNKEIITGKYKSAIKPLHFKILIRTINEVLFGIDFDDL